VRLWPQPDTVGALDMVVGKSAAAKSIAAFDPAMRAFAEDEVIHACGICVELDADNH
jgi:hypothetical protein